MRKWHRIALSSRTAWPRRWRSFSSGGRKPWKQVPHWREPDTLRVSNFEVFLSYCFKRFFCFRRFQILLHIMANPDHSASISWLFFCGTQKNCFTVLGTNIISPSIGKMIFGLTRLVGSMYPFPGWFNPHWFGQAFTNLGSYSCGTGIPVDGNRLLGYLIEIKRSGYLYQIWDMVKSNSVWVILG